MVDRLVALLGVKRDGINGPIDDTIGIYTRDGGLIAINETAGTWVGRVESISQAAEFYKRYLNAQVEVIIEGE